jgi:hypothetical protein
VSQSAWAILRISDNLPASYDGGAFGIDGNIRCRGWCRWSSWWWFIAEIEMPRSSAVRLGLYEIGCISVDVEAHGACVISDSGFWICGGIIHEHFGLCDWCQWLMLLVGLRFH